MEAFLTGVAIFGALMLSRILEPVLYRFNQRNEALDHLTQERWNIVKHTDLHGLRQDFRFVIERFQTNLDKLNEAVFPDKKPPCQLEKSTSNEASTSPVPRSL